jgi:hypothetical protein
MPFGSIHSDAIPQDELLSMGNRILEMRRGSNRLTGDLLRRRLAGVAVEPGVSRLDAVTEVQNKGESLIRLDVLANKHKLSARQRVALELAANRPEFRIEDFEAQCPGTHRRSLQRDLRTLIEKHLLVAEGATNRLMYRVAGTP